VSVTTTFEYAALPVALGVNQLLKTSASIILLTIRPLTALKVEVVAVAIEIVDVEQA